MTSACRRTQYPPRVHCAADTMPRKIRELIAELGRAGFANRGGKGGHKNFTHPNVSKPITISGNNGQDAKRYQEIAVKKAIKESKK